MIDFLLLRKGTKWSVFLHVLLGLVCIISNYFLIAFFYIAFISLVSNLRTTKEFQFDLSLTIAYIASFEIIARMTKCSPFIPYEMGKYVLFVLLITGILRRQTKASIGVAMLFLLLPALVYDFSNKVNFQGLVFNLLGPINLCLAIIFFYRLSFTGIQTHKIFTAILLPLLSALVYVYIKTPDLDQIEFQLGANFETTGGFGSNQVATIFGLGMLLMFYFWYNRISVSGYRYLDAAILFLLIFQGLLSFSRGGMIGGAVGILIYLFYETRKSKANYTSKRKVTNFMFPAMLLILCSIWIANEVTNGQLLLRYQGETNATLAGTQEKNLNTLTTNRSSIFEGDWALFNEYTFGVGAGASSYLRGSETGVSAHIELGRLVAEHGILGLLFFIIFTLFPFVYFSNQNSSGMKGILVALYFLSWYTSFHAATRTFVTPLLSGISLLYVKQRELNQGLSNNILRE